jgi:hypothetical protein
MGIVLASVSAGELCCQYMYMERRYSIGQSVVLAVLFLAAAGHLILRLAVEMRVATRVL